MVLPLQVADGYFQTVMVGDFKKFLSVSAETSRLSRPHLELERVSWKDISKIRNLSDYDHVHLNLAALADGNHRFATPNDILPIFSPESWAHVLSAGGSIFVVGDPACSVVLGGGAAGPRSPLTRLVPLDTVLHLVKHDHALDYRRVSKNDKHRLGLLYKYLDSVAQWKYSLNHADISRRLANCLERHETQLVQTNRIGQTSYSAFLAVTYHFCHVRGGKSAGTVTVLPCSFRGTEVDDLFILQECFGIATTLPEPCWVQRLKLPEETELQNIISEKQSAVRQLQGEIQQNEGRLNHCKRWYRLLYDDGHSLEAIVKEGLELIGATVTKTSKEKDDFRCVMKGFPEGVIEIKGTHNAKFAIGALRQLAGWIDAVNANEQKVVKGFFIGNAARNEEPAVREEVLFEPNCEDYARIKDIVILRTMDLFCLTTLKRLNLLNVSQFWTDFYRSKGSFDATEYWKVLPPECGLAVGGKS